PLLWSQYASHSDDSRWARDIQNLEKVNRTEKDFSQPITKTDIYETFILLQYMETVMLRFDEDRSGDLGIIETLKAFNHFKGALGSALDMSDEQMEAQHEELEAIFSYMMKYGETPFQSQLSSLRYLSWKWDRDSWTTALAADR